MLELILGLLLLTGDGASDPRTKTSDPDQQQAEASSDPAAEQSDDWLKSDLPADTQFLARDDGSFYDCQPARGVKATRDFKKACKDFLTKLGKTAAMSPIGKDSWIQQSDYPTGSLMNGEEGRVVYKVMVGMQGLPTSCEIVSSSHFALLDKATCDAIMLRAKFVPAKDRDGNPVAKAFTASVNWRIPSMMH